MDNGDLEFFAMGQPEAPGYQPGYGNSGYGGNPGYGSNPNPGYQPGYGGNPGYGAPLPPPPQGPQGPHGPQGPQGPNRNVGLIIGAIVAAVVLIMIAGG